ncbi:helix-turn-helix domain-containing protein [Occultella aeris]|uniref:HTH-type transcriptional regulator YodB n=1 Tax=Occultella aeris TaxID=2761496 RepID=A0A7M4DJ20_9MICO|nr:helix-turn-helix domain-containing protein [Occultella aeris]VZO37003.1 HTH-type transcriptional regulator YodB [Occultella aeris]
MSADAHSHAECDTGVRRAFDLLGKRWSGPILSVLRNGPMKFSELRRAVGPITDSVLADRLVDLADFGVVVRTETDGRPPQISYALTERGESLQPILDQLGRWAASELDRAPFEGCAEAGAAEAQSDAAEVSA